MTDFEFNPPVDVNSFYDQSDSINDYNDKYNSYFSFLYISEKNENTKKKDIKYKCSLCDSEESSYLCKHCNILLCNKCKNKLTKEIHIFIALDKIKSQNEKNKIIFFNSIEILIKDLFHKCNYLLKNEKIELDKGENSENSKKNYILKIVDYPSITNANDIKSHLSFLESINSLIKNDYNFYSKSFHVSKLNLKFFCPKLFIFEIFLLRISSLKENSLILFFNFLNLISYSSIHLFKLFSISFNCTLPIK